MEPSSDGKFWTGEIMSTTNAGRIMRSTAIGFGILGALLTVAAFYPRVDAGKLVVALIVLVPAILLHRNLSVVAARVLFGLSLFSVLASFAGVAYALASRWENPFLMAPIGVFWLLPLFATARACKAAKFVRSADGGNPAR
jgi:hypothetical protein